MLPAMACRLFVHIPHRHQPGVLNKEPDPASGRVRNTYPWPSAAGQGGNTYNSSPAFHRNCTSTTTLIGPPGPAIPQTIKAVRGSGQNSPGGCDPAAVMVADANIAPATLILMAFNACEHHLADHGRTWPRGCELYPAREGRSRPC
jgi:hypothetical protein